jgi:phage protein U
MAGVLMGWGPFRFECGRTAFEQLRERAAGRWEKHAIIGRRPAGQYLGPDEETVTLRGTIFPIAGIGDAGTVQGLIDAARSGMVTTLAAADGSILGPYRLEKAERVLTDHLPGGSAQKIVYDLEFHAHDDGEGQIWSLWP